MFYNTCHNQKLHCSSKDSTQRVEFLYFSLSFPQILDQGDSGFVAWSDNGTIIKMFYVAWPLQESIVYKRTPLKEQACMNHLGLIHKCKTRVEGTCGFKFYSTCSLQKSIVYQKNPLKRQASLTYLHLVRNCKTRVEGACSDNSTI